MEQVLDYYHYVKRESGSEVASEFYKLMKEWDGAPNVMNSFYSTELLSQKHKEAKETVAQY